MAGIGACFCVIPTKIASRQLDLATPKQERAIGVKDISSPTKPVQALDSMSLIRKSDFLTFRAVRQAEAPALTRP